MSQGLVLVLASLVLVLVLVLAGLVLVLVHVLASLVLVLVLVLVGLVLVLVLVLASLALVLVLVLVGLVLVLVLACPVLVNITALNPLPRYYREFQSNSRGNTANTAIVSLSTPYLILTRFNTERPKSRCVAHVPDRRVLRRNPRHCLLHKCVARIVSYAVHDGDS